MAQPSRLMAAYVRPTVPWPWRLVGYALLAAGIGSFAWGVWTKPVPVVVITTGVLVAIAFVEYRERSRLRAIGASRAGESICSYARALPMRDLDPWVVRATFEQLQPYLLAKAAAFPIRPSDRLVEDLRVDAEEINDVVVEEVAQRSGRNLADSTKNPYYGKVVTVEDLIRFICAQPKRGAAEQGDEADEAR